ncbi:hypothetical protein BH10BDE1_BH10BDE1_31140 [soil metagenome]
MTLLLRLPLFLSLGFMVPAMAHEGHVVATETAQPILGESVYNLKSQWTSQDGKVIQLQDLEGKPVVLAMAYTSCEAACPLIVEDMRKISKGMSAADQKRFSFFLFSFDSQLDTPARLKEYAKKRKLDLAHWQLFHGEPGAVRELAAVLGVRYKKDPKTNDFDHSNVITLLDGKGLIQYQQNGLGEDPKALLAKAKALSSK